MMQNATKETINTANSSFEEAKKKVAVHYMSGNDCFVSLPTGKSVCYGILLYAFNALQGKRICSAMCVTPSV